MKRTNNLALGLAAGVILASLPAEAAGLFDDFARTFFGRHIPSIVGGGPLEMIDSEKTPAQESSN